MSCHSFRSIRVCQRDFYTPLNSPSWRSEISHLVSQEKRKHLCKPSVSWQWNAMGLEDLSMAWPLSDVSSWTSSSSLNSPFTKDEILHSTLLGRPASSLQTWLEYSCVLLPLFWWEVSLIHWLAPCLERPVPSSQLEHLLVLCNPGNSILNVLSNSFFQYVLLGTL